MERKEKTIVVNAISLLIVKAKSCGIISPEKVLLSRLNYPLEEGLFGENFERYVNLLSNLKDNSIFRAGDIFKESDDEDIDMYSKEIVTLIGNLSDNINFCRDGINNFYFAGKEEKAAFELALNIVSLLEKNGIKIDKIYALLFDMIKKYRSPTSAFFEEFYGELLELTDKENLTPLSEEGVREWDFYDNLLSNYLNKLYRHKDNLKNDCPKDYLPYGIIGNNEYVISQRYKLLELNGYKLCSHYNEKTGKKILYFHFDPTVGRVDNLFKTVSDTLISSNATLNLSAANENGGLWVDDVPVDFVKLDGKENSRMLPEVEEFLIAKIFPTVESVEKEIAKIKKALHASAERRNSRDSEIEKSSHKHGV